jgi:hypothetical protein
MVFKVTKKGDFFSDNPSAELIDEFDKLNSLEMKYLCLVYDYDSIFRNMSIGDRQEKVANVLKFDRKKDGDWCKAYYDLKNLAKDDYVYAIKALKEMMTDIHKNNLIAMEKQLAGFRDFLQQNDKSHQEISASIKIVKEMETLTSMIEKKKEEISVRDNKEIIVSNSGPDVSMSLIELLNNGDVE